MKKRVLLLLSGLFLVSQAAFAQSAMHGRIVDEKGEGMSDVTVKVKGKNQGAVTDNNGNFVINATDGEMLVVSSIGYSKTEVVAAEGMKVKLANSKKGMGEVVVTAIGIKRDKRLLTYSSQEVKGDALVAAKQENIINSLAGKVSGVQISNSTGMPGSSSRIVIRGNTSLNGDNQALIIVDGVPIDNSEGSSFDLSLNQGSTSNRAIDIDPNIIESVNVLKGAAATALYGSAAARGAVIITTKTGNKSKKPQISVGSSISIDNPILAQFQDKYAQGINGNYIDGNNGTSKSSGSWGPLIDTLMVGGMHVTKHDPRKEFFKTGYTTDNNFSINGSSDKSSYLLSYSYLKANGITPGTDFQRHSMFGKFTNKISDKVTANVQFNYVNTVNHRMPEGNGLDNPLWTVYSAPISWNPLPSVDSNTGGQQLYRLSRNNPYYLLNNEGYVSTVNRILPVASIVYNPYSWMSITERIGADIYTDQATLHEAPGILGYFNRNGGVENNVTSFRQFNNDLMAEVHNELAKDLNGSFLLGTNLISTYSQSSDQKGSGLSVSDYYNINNASTQTANEFTTLKRKVGIYAQANLEYKRMFILALTSRYDGSGVLAAAHRYYPYGSAALGFIFSELIKNNDSKLSFGKARISYSVVGNDNVAAYSLATPYNATNSNYPINNIVFPFGGQNGFLLSQTLGNPNLKNETLKEFEVGLDLKFFKNRLTFESSYFNRKTTDLITTTPIAYSTGYFQGVLNAGSMRNKGLEILLSGQIIKKKNFTWEVGLTFTKIKNEVLDLGAGLNKIQFGGFGGGGGVYAFKGQPYGVIYGSMYKRNTAGKLLLDDNGLPQVSDNSGIIGNTNPDFTMGFTNSLTYKSFTFSFTLDWKQGGDIFNLDDHYNWFYGTPKATEDRTPKLIDGIQESTGLVNTTKCSVQDYYRDISSIDEACVEKATYLKLRNIGISYAIAPKILSKTPFKSSSIYFNVKNLWWYVPHFTGADPEANIVGSGNGQGINNYMTPTTRSVVIGIKLNF